MGAVLGHTRDVLEKTNANVRSLREGHEMVNATTRALQAHLEDTHAIAQSVKAGLKETNSVVLPNLTMDNVSPLSMGGNPQHTAGKTPAHIKKVWQYSAKQNGLDVIPYFDYVPMQSVSIIDITDGFEHFESLVDSSNRQE